jgi:hypothetical protein
MAHPNPVELKKVLRAQGFEIYRTTADEVVLAERVRDNLLMDSGVRVRLGEQLGVRIVLRAQGSDFPGDSADKLLGRARGLAETALTRGFRETSTQVVPVRDPGDKTRTLDTWYEVLLDRPLDDVDELEAELRSALAIEKSVRP